MSRRSLLMDVKVGQSLSIDGGRIVVTVEEKSGQRIKLRIVHDGVLVERSKAALQADTQPKPVRVGAKQAQLGSMLAA